MAERKRSIDEEIRRQELRLETLRARKKAIQENKCTTIGDRIYKEMQIKGITQEEIAKKAKITRQSLSCYCNNKTCMSAEILGSIAKTLNVSCDYLIFGEEDDK